MIAFRFSTACPVLGSVVGTLSVVAAAHGEVIGSAHGHRQEAYTTERKTHAEFHGRRSNLYSVNSNIMGLCNGYIGLRPGFRWSSRSCRYVYVGTVSFEGSDRQHGSSAKGQKRICDDPGERRRCKGAGRR